MILCWRSKRSQFYKQIAPCILFHRGYDLFKLPWVAPKAAEEEEQPVRS
jgi:hypothetical protein